MKTTLILILLTFICLSSKAQDLKNEISVDLTSLYISPRSNHADENMGGIYPLSGLRYTRHLAKFSLFASFNRYSNSSSSLENNTDAVWSHWYPEPGRQIAQSHLESSVQLGITNKSNSSKTFSPIASVSVITGQASTKRYENRYSGQYAFYEKPAQRDISYLGINSSLGLRYNINTVFHIDLSTKVGVVRTTGTYKVFINHPENPTVFEYDERAIVPMFTLAEISVGVCF